MIQEAEHSIWIVTPYFIPDEVLLRSLIVKARAGCKVTLIVPERSNHPVTDFARRNFTRALTGAGGRVLHYVGGMLHAKAVVVDERVALIGSPNFDLRSLFVNFEIGVIIYTRQEIAEIKVWIDELARRSRTPVFREGRASLRRRRGRLPAARAAPLGPGPGGPAAKGGIPPPPEAPPTRRR